MEIGGDEPDTGPNPWAPGGTMSAADASTSAPRQEQNAAGEEALTRLEQHPTTGVDPAGNQPASETATLPGDVTQRSVPRWLIPVVAIVAVAVGTAVVAAATGHDDERTAPTTTAPPPSTAATTEPSVPTPLRDQGTSIGDVRWNRVVDDAANLPSVVVASSSGEFIGRDDNGSLSWVSAAGVEWAPLDVASPTVVAGQTWSIGSEDGMDDRLALSIIDGSDRTPVNVSHSPAARSGMQRVWAAPAEGAGPYAIGEQVFVQLDRREAIPWDEAVDVPEDGSPFMVRVSVEGGSYLSFQSAVGNTDAATDVWAVRRGGQVDLET
ncbi:MAG: hypothetical protein AAFY28_15930, partial [Actinomycetota bacterium]